MDARGPTIKEKNPIETETENENIYCQFFTKALHICRQNVQNLYNIVLFEKRRKKDILREIVATIVFQ